AVELRPCREVHGKRVLQRLLDHGVRPPSGEHPEPRQEVRVGVTLGVVEVGPLAAHVVLVEPNRVQRTRHLRVQLLAVQLVPLPTHSRKLSAQIKAHWRILSARVSVQLPQTDDYVSPQNGRVFHRPAHSQALGVRRVPKSTRNKRQTLSPKTHTPRGAKNPTGVGGGEGGGGGAGVG